MNEDIAVRELVMVAKDISAAKPSYRDIDRKALIAIEDAVHDLMEEALDMGLGRLVARDVDKAVKDISEEYGLEKSLVEDFFWEEFHNSEWPDD